MNAVKEMDEGRGGHGEQGLSQATKKAEKGVSTIS